MTATCLPCCTSGGGCSCALLIPALGSPYADYATAVTAIADLVSNCIGYTNEPTNTFAATLGTGQLLFSLSNSTTLISSQLEAWGCVSLSTSDTLQFDWITTSSGPAPLSPVSDIQINIYVCTDGAFTLVENHSDSDAADGLTGTWTSSALPADGIYYVQVQSNSWYGRDTTSSSASWTITGSAAMIVNPVIALWDDSGTTRSLWACPKLLLPPLTESTGDWYASCADAATVLTDPLKTSNCVGYNQGGPGLSAFTATDGGTSLTLACTGVAGVITWGGVNCVGGQTLTVNASVSAGTVDVIVQIYDDTGTLVDSTTATSPPWTSSALPYTGRYTVRIVVESTTGSANTSAVITSSGTMSVNPIAAAWDNGLTCPSYLNCGDSC